MESERKLDLLSVEDVNEILRKSEEGTLDTNIYELYGTKLCDVCHIRTSINSCKAYPNGIPEDVSNGTNWSIDCLSD